MPDQVVTQANSADAAAIPSGTAAPASDSSQDAVTEGAKTQAPGFDEDFLKKLDTLDPSKIDPATLPVEFNRRFVPTSEFTKKTQALAEEKKKFEAEKAAVFELARKAIADRPTGPAGPTPEDIKRKELQDLAAAGDAQALQQLVQMEAERQITPIRTETALRNAYETAVRANAYVAPHWNEIVQIMQTDPDIAAMATANGMRGASKVMIALGLEREVMDLRPKFEAATKEIEGLKAKLASYEKERAASLPSSTSRAGTTVGRPTPGEPSTLEEAALKAWIESGGRPEDFR